MQIYTKYIAWVYIKTFFIVFIALELFFIGVGLLTNLDNIPKSANLALLYMLYSSGIAIKYILPLSIVLASIISVINFIRNNELVSFLALGLNKSLVFRPILVISILIILVYIVLQSTPLAYANDLQKTLTTKQEQNYKSNFLKDDNKMIYFITSSKGDKKVIAPYIFEFDGDILKRKITGHEASYNGKEWSIAYALALNLPNDAKLGQNGFLMEQIFNYKFLKGFNPQVVYNLQDSNSEYSVFDALKSMEALKSQDLNTTQIRASLYFTIFFPFFAPFMSLIMYYYMPVISRFSSLSIAGFLCVLTTLCVWGVLFALWRFGQNGVILPEIAVILPVMILGAFGAYKYKTTK